MNLSSRVPTSSSSAKSPIASKSPGILTATEKPESRMRRNSKSDAASTSQVRLQNAYFGGLMDKATEKPVATEEDSGDVDLSESETGSEEDVTGKPMAHKTVTGKPYASSKSDLEPPFIIREQSSRPSGFGREYVFLWHISECQSSSSSSSWTRL